MVIAYLWLWFSPIELVLENTYLAIQCNKLVVKRSCGIVWFLRRFTIRSFFTTGGLSLGLLNSDISSSCFCIKVSCHEVLIGVQIFVEIYDVVYGNFIRVSCNCRTHELFHPLSFTLAIFLLTVHRGNMPKVTDK